MGGLPYYLKLEQVPVIEFDPYNLDEVRRVLSRMPAFIEWIETKRRQNFFETLGKIVTSGLAVLGLTAIIAGVVGVLFGSSKK